DQRSWMTQYIRAGRVPCQSPVAMAILGQLGRNAYAVGGLTIAFNEDASIQTAVDFISDHVYAYAKMVDATLACPCSFQESLFEFGPCDNATRAAEELAQMQRIGDAFMDYLATTMRRTGDAPLYRANWSMLVNCFANLASTARASGIESPAFADADSNCQSVASALGELLDGGNKSP